MNNTIQSVALEIKKIRKEVDGVIKDVKVNPKFLRLFGKRYGAIYQLLLEKKSNDEKLR